MPKLIIQHPYVIKSSCRKEQFDELVKSWKEGGIIAVDATTRITLVRDDEKIDEIIAGDIVDNDKWTTITESTFTQYEPSIYECPKCGKRVTVRTLFCPECGDDKRLRVKNGGLKYGTHKYRFRFFTRKESKNHGKNP